MTQRFGSIVSVMLGAAAAMHRGEHTLLGYFRDRFGRRTVRPAQRRPRLVSDAQRGLSRYIFNLTAI